MHKQRILVLPKYSRNGASSRVRFYNYLSYFPTHFEFHFHPLFKNRYIEEKKLKKTNYFNVFLSYLNRITILLKIRWPDYDRVWIEQELFPRLPTFFELYFIRKMPALILDYDDAVFHKYDSGFASFFLRNKIQKINNYSAQIVVGNAYIAGYFQRSEFASKTFIIPSCIEVVGNSKIKNRLRQPIIVGWIGQPYTSKYLIPYLPLFRSLSQEGRLKFMFMGVTSDNILDYPFETIEWSEDNEKEFLSLIDVGIMPLPDDDFERGKCGYKLLQYLSYGKPAIASSVGVNRDIINDGVNGYLADSIQEWDEKLRLLENSPHEFTAMSNECTITAKKYSYEIWVDIYSELLNSKDI